MSEFIEPIVVVSKCLGFDYCRYNGYKIDDYFVSKLRDYVRFIPVCPEVEIGLGVPRDPVRLVKASEEGLRLVQASTERDLTRRMKDFSEGLINSLEEVDGFILKEKSPSCATKNSKIYIEMKGKIPAGKSAGIFTQTIREIISNPLIENEGRLRNYRIREDFLTKLYLRSRFRKVKRDNRVGELVEFHSRNKLLLFSYNEIGMRKLGEIVANHQQLEFDEVIKKYEEVLYQLLSSKTKYTSNINVMMHALGFFSKYLIKEEKEFFLDTLERYRNNKVPLSVPVNILKAWIIKYEADYLKKQSFFNPYPEELIEIKDSGKGRDL
ncbi:YbgA family protein [Orenia marismortui]|uniref:Uncharacterized protein YbgA (DUF1722 family) n=1 Tax=Orenia marismortui TaxID=46469 RepID=A0A4R8HA96_9FIRM|nr:DUF523 and DUF1722 domain-containing protein [Orenia marismortui]TDX53213.1 uncharacterized protein YbgA (DUF1722 family) [Orenia marismortui]